VAKVDTPQHCRDIILTINGKKQHTYDILTDLRRQNGDFRDIEARTEREFTLLQRDLEQFVEEYNLAAEREADQRPYQWTIEAYIKCRVGDTYMGTFQHLLKELKPQLDATDTMERLTNKPTIWKHNIEQHRVRMRQKRAQLRQQTHKTTKP